MVTLHGGGWLSADDLGGGTGGSGRRPDEVARYLANPLTIRPGATVMGIRDQYQKPLFALMAIVPGALIYGLSVQFLARSIESWFEVRVDKALESGLNGVSPYSGRAALLRRHEATTRQN